MSKANQTPEQLARDGIDNSFREVLAALRKRLRA